MHRMTLRRFAAALLVLGLLLSSAAQAATWTIEAYIRLYANGGKFSDGKTFYVKKFTTQISTNDPAYVPCTMPSVVPTRTGYIFSGWASMLNKPVDGVIYDVSGKLNYYFAGSESWVLDDLYTDYCAYWVPKTYAMTFYSAGAQVFTATKTYGVDTVIPDTIPEREGHDFLGWDTASTATKVVYNPGDAFTKNAAQKFYAVWKAHTYTVEFDANGGTKPPAALTKTHGKKLLIPKTKPTRTGYTFAGWAESPDATEVEFAVQAALPDRNIKLYAVWKPVLASGGITVAGDDRSEARQTVTEDVYINLKSTMKYVDVILTYPTMLRYKGLVKHDFPYDLYCAERTSGDQRILEITGYCEEGFSRSGVSFLARLQFDVEEDGHEFGDYEISVSSDTYILNANSETVKPTTFGAQSFAYLPYAATGIEITTPAAVTRPVQLSVRFTPEYTTDKRVKWSIAETDKAVIDEQGLLTPLKNGAVTVSASTVDGSNLTVEKEFIISGQKAALTGLSAATGEWSAPFTPGVYDYTLCVPEGTDSVGLTFSFDGGTLLCDGYGYCVSGMPRTLSLGADEQVFTFLRRADDLDDSQYRITVKRASLLDMYARRLILPADTVRIEDGAFENTAFRLVMIGDGCVSIGSRAFADCGELCRIVIPASVSQIADDAFEGCDAGLIFMAPESSEAELFAALHGFEFEARE